MTETEKLILNKLNTMEEALKMLLVNDVLKDAENLTGQNQVSVRQHELQSKIDELQKRLKEKETEISKLLSQLETQKGRIKTLQDMSGSKDRTIQTKEERIQILQQSVKTKDDSISRLQSQIEKQQMEIEALQQGEMGAYINRICILRTGEVYEDNTAFRQKCYVHNAVGKYFIIDDYDTALGMFHISQNTNKKKHYHFWVNVNGVDII